MYLGADIDYKSADKRSSYAPTDPVIGTAIHTSCVRNVWTLVPFDKSRDGKELKYGDSFYICLFKAEKPLYVSAPTNSPCIPKGECGYSKPTLIKYKGNTAR